MLGTLFAISLLSSVAGCHSTGGRGGWSGADIGEEDEKKKYKTMPRHIQHKCNKNWLNKAPIDYTEIRRLDKTHTY